MVIYVGNNVYTQYQIDTAPRRAFERGNAMVETNRRKIPFIPRDKEIANLAEFMKECAVRGKYVVLIGEVFIFVIHLTIIFILQ
jgi:hypothetical protein